MPSRLPAVLVASMGRSGSTLIHAAAVDAFARLQFGPLARFARDIAAGEAWDLATTPLRSGVVYKTHGLASELPSTCRPRVIFVFGPPSDAVLSVMSCHQRFGAAWTAAHLRHLRASGDYSDLANEDVLRMQDQVEGWFGAAGVPRLLLHYDAIWDQARTISAFIGAKIRLPEYQRRSPGDTRIDAVTVDAVRRTYAPLDRKIADLPRCVILN